MKNLLDDEVMDGYIISGVFYYGLIEFPEKRIFVSPEVAHYEKCGFGHKDHFKKLYNIYEDAWNFPRVANNVYREIKERIIMRATPYLENDGVYKYIKQLK